MFKVVVGDIAISTIHRDIKYCDTNIAEVTMLLRVETVYGTIITEVNCRIRPTYVKDFTVQKLASTCLCEEFYFSYPKLPHNIAYRLCGPTVRCTKFKVMYSFHSLCRYEHIIAESNLQKERYVKVRCPRA